MTTGGYIEQARWLLEGSYHEMKEAVLRAGIARLREVEISVGRVERSLRGLRRDMGLRMQTLSQLIG
ncbi:hypothetical protein KEJ13_03750 [Candidatus Bathyarchaeota archaeon]|nr:hypothetical protein [Candidatus Bathyarchaeota archaeon]